VSGVVSTADPLDEPGSRVARLPLKLAIFALAALATGAIAGVIWWKVVRLPEYLVAPSGRATTSERGLAQFMAADAWFTVLGAILGVALGLLAWRLFARLGWRVAVLATGGAFLAGVFCWQVGHQLGPSDFAPRLVTAKPGESVPVELILRAKAALAAWPFAASIPILLGSSLGRDDEIPARLLEHDGGT
jgi:hypothetical protein